MSLFNIFLMFSVIARNTGCRALYVTLRDAEYYSS